MHVDIRVAIIAGFFALAGVSTPLIWPILFPSTPYVALPSIELNMGDSARVDGGLYKLQAQKVSGQPHRFRALIVGGTTDNSFRHDFPELMKGQRVLFADDGKEYALHVKELSSGDEGHAKSVVVEIDRLK